MPFDWLEHWRNSGAREGQRLLWLSPVEPPPALEGCGAQVTWTRQVDPLDHPDASFDQVLVCDVMGAHEWDRWLLQEIQRVLVPGGVMLVTVPNLRRLATPADAWFLFGRAQVQADRRLRRLLSLPPREYPFRGRRYRIEQFLDLLPPLGFADFRCWPEPGSAQPPLFAVSATAGPSRYGAGDLRPWPDAAAHRARYESGNAHFLAMRERWCAEQGRMPEVAKPLEPGSGDGPVLVLAPHPDDEVIGCGGTLARWIAAGAPVHCLQATDGSEGAALRDEPAARRRTIRLDEAAAVGRAIGFEHIEFWRADNGRFQLTDELVNRMVALLDEVRPGVVLTPFVADLHPDHFTLNRIFARALERSALELRVLQYEVWGLVPANTWCDVTAGSSTLERLLRLYRTAMKVDDFVHFCEDRNLYHSIRHAGRVGLAESFLETDGRHFAQMVRAGETSRGL